MAKKLITIILGLLSRELIPYAKSIAGVDISQRMVDEYNRRAANQGLSVDEMRAVRADILSSESDELWKLRGSCDVVVVRPYDLSCPCPSALG